MSGKLISVILLAIVGIYFLVFHSEPFPLSHDAIGLPPFHVVHSLFGLILLAGAAYLWRKK